MHPSAKDLIADRLAEMSPEKLPLLRWGFWLGLGWTVGVALATALLSALGLMLFVIWLALKAVARAL